MTFNRLLTSLVQLALWLPVFYFVREMIRESRNK